ncbi:MAG: hypothetical protein GX930_10175 [Clostridia bacterium]|jgi:hypothetical protein|nr:hypothetical protein [Clostridia bacterium]
MRIDGKKMSMVFLTFLMVIFLLVPAAASTQVNLVFNGYDYQADVYVENGVSYISGASLQKIPGLQVEQDGYIPLRSFFESREAKVDWDNSQKEINVSWCEMNGDWSADELMIASTKVLQEINSYKLRGNTSIEMAIMGQDTTETQNIPKINTLMEGVFQQEPMAMYCKQTAKLPLEDMEITEEEAQLFDQGEMTTEMVWKDNAIYQKMSPFSDQWIMMDLAEMDLMDNLTNMLQTSPQQSLEMMREFGVIYLFGEDVEINGQDYYTVKNYVDSLTFKKIFEEYMGALNLNSLITEPGTGEEESAENTMSIEQIMEELLATMELDYYIDSFINKDTLRTEKMRFNMELKYQLDETVNPEGPIAFDMKIAGEFDYYDFGTEVELPDVSDAITQEELIEQMNTMEVPEEE